MVQVEDIDVDQIWRSLGPLGKYQIKQIVCIMWVYVSWAVHTLSIVFIGFRPNYQCKLVNASTLNASDVWQEYGQCDITTYQNTTEGLLKLTETGCENGWQYDIPIEQSFVTEWDFVCENAELAELTQSVMTIGMMVGALIFPPLSDRVGRKPPMVISHIMLFGLVLGTSFSPNYTTFVVLRLLTGLVIMGGLAATTTAVEIFPKEIRFYAEIMGLMVWTTTICLMSPVAFAFRNISWRYLQVTLSLISCVSLVQWWVFDESLRWVIANGKLDKARTIIKNVCRWNKRDYATVMRETGLSGVFDDVHQGNGAAEKLNGAIIDEKHRSPTIVVKNVSVLDMVRNSQLRKVSMIVWFLWTTDSLVYYGLFMISSELYGNRYINFFLSGLLEYPAGVFEWFALNRLGRRWTCLICHLVATIGLILATGFIYGAAGNTAMLAAGTAFTFVGKMGITGAFSTAFILTPELYPTNLRSSGLGAAAFVGRFGFMISPFFRNVGEKIAWLPGFVFSIMCLITVVLLAFVPEPKGVELPQTMDELAEWYKGNSFSLSCGKKKRTKKGHNAVS